MFLKSDIEKDNAALEHNKTLEPGTKKKNIRYGGVRMTDASDDEFTVDDAEASNPDISSTDNFMIAKAILNKGYVYLINVDDDTDCHELEIGEDGRMNHIIWDKENFYPDKKVPKDKRKPEEKENLHYKLIINNGEEGTGRTFWVSYSPVQWSYEMFVNVLGMTDTQREERGMVLVSTAGVKKGEETAQEHVVPYTKLVFGYDKENGNYHNHYKERLNQVHAIEKKETEAAKKDQNDENEIYEDMFITLHDPVGAANDIKNELLAKNGELSAIVESIYTGETQEEALERLANGTDRTEIKEDYSAMVRLALTCYKMMYTKVALKNPDEKPPRNGRDRRNWHNKRRREQFPNMKYDGGVTGWNPLYDRDHQNKPNARGYSRDFNPDADKSGKKGLDRSKIEGILGVDLRTTKRKEVILYRDELGNFIKTKYFRGVLDFYLGSNECKIHGVDLMYKFLSLLSKNPYDIDKLLLLPQDYKEDDPWVNFTVSLLFDEKKPSNEGGNINSILPEYADADTLYTLLDTEVRYNLEQLASVSEDVTNKGAAALKSLIELTVYKMPSNITQIDGKIVQEVEARLKMVLNSLNKRAKTMGGEDAFTIKKKQLYLKLKQHGVRLNVDEAFMLAGAPREGYINFLKEGSGVEHLGTEEKRKRKMRNGRTRRTTTRRHTMEFPVLEQQNVALRQKLKFQLQKVLEGRAFTGALAILQVFNMKAALAATANDFNLKNSIGAVGVGLELTEALKTFQGALMKEATEEAAKKVARQAARAGLIANVFTTFICGWDTLDAIDRRDTDAAVAFGLATLAFGTATVASTSIVGGALVISGGPIVWIAVGIGFGLVVIAHLLTDTAAETYFKNFLLSDHCKDYYRPKTGDYSPSAYARLLIDNKKDLVDDEDYEDTLMHPQDAEARFFDITTCKTMVFKPHGEYNTITTMDSSHTYLETESYTIRIGFNHFFQSTDQAEYGAYIFDDVVSDAEPLFISRFEEPKKEGNELVLKVAIPKKYRRIGSQIMIVTRLVIDPEAKMYFPYPILKDKGAERWMGARVPINKMIFFTNDLMSSENIKFDTLDRLINVGNWQGSLVRYINGTEKDE